MLFGEEAKKAQERTQENRRFSQNRPNTRSGNSRYQRRPEKKKEFSSLYFKKKF